MQEPTPDQPIAIDLARVASRLNDQVACPDLVKVIERTRRVASCVVDLEHAADALKVLADLDPQALPDSVVRPLRQSLLYSALSWYARATSTAAQRGERGSFAPRFDARLAEMHGKIRHLRNTAFAHVDFDAEGHDFSWHSACVALVMDGVRQGVFSIAASSDYDPEISDMLTELVPAAHEQMLELESKARGTAVRMLADVAGDGFEVTMEDDALDLAHHFGSDEGGAVYLRALLDQGS
ncbi:hypothetical protein [Sphingomonas sp. BK069]|uniref:hypothetical protein n=1 Tax=Sphingomonas sp. BK069 TaxID=2586979 RepID=UPI0016203373|nr:hypothetical protein [Sphingomonas sp. BK069]MBB3348335.1 hypothetical protein [Sphingomonas sp. BK069]